MALRKVPPYGVARFFQELGILEYDFAIGGYQETEDSINWSDL